MDERSRPDLEKEEGIRRLLCLEVLAYARDYVNYYQGCSKEHSIASAYPGKIARLPVALQKVHRTKELKYLRTNAGDEKTYVYEKDGKETELTERQHQNVKMACQPKTVFPPELVEYTHGETSGKYIGATRNQGTFEYHYKVASGVVCIPRSKLGVLVTANPPKDSVYMDECSPISNNIRHLGKNLAPLSLTQGIFHAMADFRPQEAAQVVPAGFAQQNKKAIIDAYREHRHAFKESLPMGECKSTGTILKNLLQPLRHTGNQEELEGVKSSVQDGMTKTVARIRPNFSEAQAKVVANMQVKRALWFMRHLDLPETVDAMHDYFGKEVSLGYFSAVSNLLPRIATKKEGPTDTGMEM